MCVNFQSLMLLFPGVLNALTTAGCELAPYLCCAVSHLISHLAAVWGTMQRYLPFYHGSGAEAASSTESDRASAEHNVGMLKETRVAQSWGFVVWEHREWTVRPLNLSSLVIAYCLGVHGEWLLWPAHVSLLQVVLSLVMETHCRFPQDA